MFWRNISPPSSGLMMNPYKKPANTWQAEVHLCLYQLLAGFMFGLLFDPEDGGDMSNFLNFKPIASRDDVGHTSLHKTGTSFSK
jgi:hypothetical protein